MKSKKKKLHVVTLTSLKTILLHGIVPIRRANDKIAYYFKVQHWNECIYYYTHWELDLCTSIFIIMLRACIVWLVYIHIYRKEGRLRDAIILVLLEGILQGDVGEPASSIRIFGISSASRFAHASGAIVGVLHGGVLSVADEIDGVEVVVAVLLVVCIWRVRSLVGRSVLRGHFLHEVDGVGLGHA